MRHITFGLVVFLATSAAAWQARAQVFVDDLEPLVNQYMNDAFAERSDAWWEALESQLILSIDPPYSEVDQVAIRNVIFFASVCGDKLDLGRAAPKFLEISRKHPVDEMRVLSLVALHAINDHRYLREACRTGLQDRSRLVRQTAMASARVHGLGR